MGRIVVRALGFTILGAALLASAPPAAAQYGGDGAVLRVSETNPFAGDRMQVWVERCAPGSTVVLSLVGPTAAVGWGSGKADDSGAYSAETVVPDDAPGASHIVEATCDVAVLDSSITVRERTALGTPNPSPTPTPTPSPTPTTAPARDGDRPSAPRSPDAPPGLQPGPPDPGQPGGEGAGPGGERPGAPGPASRCDGCLLVTSDGDSSDAVAGQRLRISGSGYAPGASVVLTLGGEVRRTLAVVRADSDGSFSVEVRLPADISGTQTVIATGPDPEGRTRTLTTSIEVAAAAASRLGDLAGSGIARPVWWWVVLVTLASLVLVVLWRRRDEEEDDDDHAGTLLGPVLDPR